MRFWITVGLVSLLGVIGCGRKAPPRPVGSAVPYLPAAAGDPEAAQPAVDSSQAQAKQQAAQWGPKLLDADEEVRSQAVQILKGTGEEAYPYVLKALRSQASEDRLAGLEVLSVDMLLKHGVEVVPLLLTLLDDRDPEVRRQVVERLPLVDQQVSETDIEVGPFGRQRVEALQKVAKTDRDPNIQQLAEENILKIQQAINGKVGALPRPKTDLPADTRPGDRDAPKRELR